MPYQSYIKSKAATPSNAIIHAKIMELQEGGGYTFIKLQNHDLSHWAAVRKDGLKMGDLVSFANPLVMENFYSKSLDKTFTKILFISELTKVSDSHLPGK